jgi:hypothetical protein
MSNPFAIFRKNKNYWMAALVLVSILAFVVAPAIMQVQDSLRGGGAQNAVAVRWNGGQMTVADLQNSMQKHGALVRFLSGLAREVVESGGEPGVPGFRFDPQSKQILELGIQSNSSEESICRTRILADKAKSLGVQFTDEAIDDFILAYCDGRVSTKRLAEILREAGDGRLSNFDVRELLKQELAAMVVLSTGTTGLYASVPGETYQDFLKLNQTAKVEAFPVFVADYVSDVKGAPSATEMQTIYDIGSNRIADPNSADPGFVQPYQANVEYVEVNLQQWVDREKAKLTEEQLRAEYDRRVALEQLKVPVNSPSSPADAAPAEPAPAESTPAESAPAAAAAAAESTPGAPAETPAAPAGSDTLDLSPPSPATGTPQTGTPQTGTPQTGTPGTGDQSSRSAPRIRLVSMLQDEAGLPPPVVQPPQLEAASPAPAVADATTPAAASDSSGTAMRTQTFEEARDQIATSLAQSTAFQSLDIPLTEIQKAMTEYYGAYRQWAAFRDADLQASGEKVEEPRRPNLKKMAEDAGLTYGQTGKTDGYKLVQTQFGMSDIRDEGMGLAGSAAQVVMNPELALFQPLQSSYIDRNAAALGNLQFYQYLFWKTEESAVQIPEMDAIRQEIVDYWKQTQARKLAENAAAALSKKVSGTGDSPWQAALSTAEQSLVIETDPFTWISRMGDYHMPSTVNKLDNVGGEFMQSVFNTAAGQVTVAPNQSRSVYYVVRVEELGPEPSELQQRFGADPDKRGAMAIAQEESNRLVQGWLDNLYNELGVEFQIPLNQL